ncbi:MAG: AEC family transporter [Eubacteriales bacterium]|nr:AEC family transporter [Eubacteriales bacterium]
MENFIFSINATAPVFLMMCLGYLLKRIHWMEEEFALKINSFVFKVPLPVLLFYQLGSADFVDSWDGKFVGFCFLSTVLSILLVAGVSFLAVREGKQRGEFIQASYRSSAAILGIAYITNIYGQTAMAPLMILGAVPLYNIMAVVVLTVTSSGSGKLEKAVLMKTLKGILTNPIILGILFGFLWSLSGISFGNIASKTLTNIGNLATPLGLMAMGASVDFQKLSGAVKPALVATFFKLVGLCMIFLPLAVMFGFRGEQLVAIVVMLGSATTVTSYVMAKNMGHEGSLSSCAVILTTILSSFTLTFWIFFIRSMGWI